MNSLSGEEPEPYQNRKGYFSLNVQEICDSNLNFINIVANWYGSAYDSRIFEHSTIIEDLESGYIIGDSRE